MAKNKLSDLRNHLFAQLERLNDESLTKEQQAMEVQKARSMQGIAKEMNQSARLELDAYRVMQRDDEDLLFIDRPKQLGE